MAPNSPQDVKRGAQPAPEPREMKQGSVFCPQLCLAVPGGSGTPTPRLGAASPPNPRNPHAGEPGEQLEQPRGVRGGTTQGPTLLPHLWPHHRLCPSALGSTAAGADPRGAQPWAHRHGEHLRDPHHGRRRRPRRHGRTNPLLPPSTPRNATAPRGIGRAAAGLAASPPSPPTSPALLPSPPLRGRNAWSRLALRLDSAPLAARSNSFQMCAAAASCLRRLCRRYVVYF